MPSIQFRHEEVGDNKVKEVGAAGLDRLLTILDSNDLMAIMDQGLLQGPSNQEFVVGNKYSVWQGVPPCKSCNIGPDFGRLLILLFSFCTI